MQLTNKEMALKRWLIHEKNLFINNIKSDVKEYPVIKQITDNYLSNFINRYNNLHNNNK